MALSARQQAQRDGRRTYHGKACGRCRLTEKYTGSGTCVDCAKQGTRERVATGYFKKYQTTRNARQKAARSGRVFDSTKITYLIGESGVAFVKIGVSTRGELATRLRTLQCGNPRRLAVIAIIDGNCEDGLHNKFRHLKQPNEWFRYHGDIVQEFDEKGRAHDA